MCTIKSVSSSIISHIKKVESQSNNTEIRNIKVPDIELQHSKLSISAILIKEFLLTFKLVSDVCDKCLLKTCKNEWFFDWQKRQVDFELQSFSSKKFKHCLFLWTNEIYQ